MLVQDISLYKSELVLLLYGLLSVLDTFETSGAQV